MANQAIALQARAPQSAGLGSAIQQNSMLINQMMQMQNAQRQTQQAQQRMDLDLAEEARAAEKFNLDKEALMYAKYRNMAPAVIQGGPAVYAAWLDGIQREAPEQAQLLRQAMPPEQFNKDNFILMMGTMDQNFEARYGKAITKELITPEGGVMGANISGIPGATYAVPVPDISRPVGGKGAPAAASSAPALTPSAGGVSARPTRGANTGPQDLLRQGVDPRSIPMGNPLVKPISAEQSGVEPLTMENAPQIVQAALDSGFIDPVHVEQLKQMLPPENQAAVDQWVQQSGLKMGSGVPGARSAVYRPQQADFGPAVADDGMSFEGPQAPMGQQVQYNPNDYAPVRVKSPMQAPETAIPGSAKVPLKRVREEAQAQRRSPQEIYQEKRTEKQAEADADFLEKYGAAKDAAQNTLSVINQMIGDLQVVNGQIKQGKRAPHGGFESVVGAGIPGLRFIPGTQSADFDALLDQIEGGAFLKAYESLKGTGQITEIEGQKATQALTRMRRSSSEVGFVKAAREFEGIIRRGMERAEQRRAKLEGGEAPRATGTPTKRGRNIDDLLKKYGG